MSHSDPGRSPNKTPVYVWHSSLPGSAVRIQGSFWSGTMESQEIWKDIVGYEGRYQVSNKGRVMSFVGQGFPHNKGYRRLMELCGKFVSYKQVVLFKNKKAKNCLVHSLDAFS